MSMMDPVTTIVLTFTALSFAAKRTWEWIEFSLKSNWKYRILNSLVSYLHYGADIGIDATLSLDGPSSDVKTRRLQGQKYLDSKLNSSGSKATRGSTLGSRLVDCRFALTKVCMPLLRELEFHPQGRNFVVGVRNACSKKETGDEKSSGILQVETEDGSVRPYVGNDAVCTLGMGTFYKPLQQEINRRMSPDNESYRLKFAPIALNAAIEKNVELVRELTGLDQVRYCLSGSEAMNAAFKDCKASSNKNVIVRFTSAYHGHISGISFLDCPDHVFLPECNMSSVEFIEKYHFRIAAVVVNPMQHFTGINKPSPPGEKITLTQRIRTAVSRDEYARWLHALQEKCTYCTSYLSRVAFVVDDVYFAFRTSELISSKYFVHPDTGLALSPDVMILGKGIAAGYPLSMVVGKSGYLNTYDKKFLLKVNKTVGTLSAWHGGIVASNVFLEAVMGKGSIGRSLPDVKEELRKMMAKFDCLTKSLNARFEAEKLPVRIRNFSNVFSIDYLNKSFYNSRYPQYLLAEGVFLGNYSTGKFNLTADCTTNDLKVLEDKFVAAATKAQEHGYFEPMSSRARLSLYGILAVRFTKNYAKLYCDQIMADKHIDIEVSHNHPVNKWGHFWSSVFMILFAYPYIFLWGETLTGCAWFFATHVVRQAGHFFYEQQDRNIEKRKFGHKDRSKKEAVTFLALCAVCYQYRLQVLDFVSQYVDPEFLDFTLEQYVSIAALFTVIPHFVEISYEFGLLRGISWMIKILTDPFTDLIDFHTYMWIHPAWFLDLKDQRAIYMLDIKTKNTKKIDQ